MACCTASMCNKQISSLPSGAYLHAAATAVQEAESRADLRQGGQKAGEPPEGQELAGERAPDQGRDRPHERRGCPRGELACAFLCLDVLLRLFRAAVAQATALSALLRAAR